MMLAWTSAIGMIAVLLLLIGASRLWSRERRKALLMAAAAIVLGLNVWLWSSTPQLPPSSQPPARTAPEQ